MTINVNLFSSMSLILNIGLKVIVLIKWVRFKNLWNIWINLYTILDN